MNHMTWHLQVEIFQEAKSFRQCFHWCPWEFALKGQHFSQIFQEIMLTDGFFYCFQLPRSLNDLKRFTSQSLGKADHQHDNITQHWLENNMLLFLCSSTTVRKANPEWFGSSVWFLTVWVTGVKKNTCSVYCKCKFTSVEMLQRVTQTFLFHTTQHFSGFSERR